MFQITVKTCPIDLITALSVRGNSHKMMGQSNTHEPLSVDLGIRQQNT